MADKKLGNLSIEELNAKKKTLKTLSYVLLAILIVYGIFMFYKMLNGTWESRSPLITVPLFIAAIIFLINANMKKVDAELEKREST